MPRKAKQNFSEAFVGLKSDYNAAKASRYRRRRTGVAAGGSGADYHYRTEADYLRMVEQARDMDRNDSVVGQMVDRAVANTIQDGISLDPNTGDKKLDADLLARWSDFCLDSEACDVSGEHDFSALESLSFRQTLVDGDIVALGLDSGHIQMVEGHRLRTPRTKRNVVNGVLLDGARRRVEYWITQDDINPLGSVSRVSDMVRVPTRDALGHRQVFQVYNPKRVSQTRGVTAFAPVFDLLGMFEDVNFAKLVQQQIVSCFAIFTQREAEMTATADAQTGPRTQETQADGSVRTIEGIAPGMQIKGAPGETMHGFSPNVPNAEYFEQVKLILTLVGANIGLPLVIALMDAKETNFSGWRGAVDQARIGFKHNQRWLIRRFHKPVYRWKVRQWLTDDAALRSASARLGIDIMRHRWNAPRWTYIEPLKDANADSKRIEKWLTSPRRLHAERGTDWDDVSTEIVEDNAAIIVKAKQKAKEINSRPGLDDANPVVWRELVQPQAQPAVPVESPTTLTDQN